MSMEYNQRYELVLNHITCDESETPFEATYPNYIQMVYLYLKNTGKYLLKEDIENKYPSLTFETILKQYPDRFMKGMIENRFVPNGKREQVWYDTIGLYEVKENEILFDFFFACKIRHLDVFEIDEFLYYHFEMSFDWDIKKYLRFLKLTLIKHKQLIPSDLLLLVNDWVAVLSEKYIEKEIYDQSSSTIQRNPNDDLTVLNVEQTALLLHIMMESRVILNEEHLPNNLSELAFSMLTGYNADLIQQKRSIAPYDKKYKKNLIALREYISKLQLLLEQKIKELNYSDKPLLE